MKNHETQHNETQQLTGRLLRDESGQDMAEYAVLLALVALAVVASVALLGDSIASTFNNIGTSVSGAEITS